jgi:hypothetical protein
MRERASSLVATRASVAHEVLGSTPHRSEFSGESNFPGFNDVVLSMVGDVPQREDLLVGEASVVTSSITPGFAGRRRTCRQRGACGDFVNFSRICWPSLRRCEAPVVTSISPGFAGRRHTRRQRGACGDFVNLSRICRPSLRRCS